MTGTGTIALAGEIESPRPLRARAGDVQIVGWCLIPGEADAPPVRLVTDAGTLTCFSRQTRADVPRLYPGESAAHHCGFEITGWLPAGVHLARFDARSSDGVWRTFKTLTLAVERRPFVASIELPTGPDPITQRVHVEGWALDPLLETSEIDLRYGHQVLPCAPGSIRTDVPKLYPDSPHASRAGFRSRTILSAGHGALRVRAQFTDGTVALSRTALRIAIDEDENHPRTLRLDGRRIPLPGYERQTIPPVERTDTPLNLLFVLHGNFTANSTLQACALANELADAGHECVIAVPRDLETLRHQFSPRFRACLHDEAVSTGGGFSNGRGPDIVHAWTTRERIRIVTTEVLHRHGGRLCIQLEDNEQEILAHATGRPYSELTHLPETSLADLVSSELSHPIHGSAFLATADGVTVIVDRLRDFVPAGKPCATIWPAADARHFFPRPHPHEFRALLDVAPNTTVLFYHGNVHAANAAEMRELYAAVAMLNRDGEAVCLLRAGVDQVAFLDDKLAHAVSPHIVPLGQILNHRHLPPLMALADIFVQPGGSDAFNDYRFPSKLPEFFAIGRPVILPKSNLGEHLRHGEDAYVLDRTDAQAIAAAIRDLRANPSLADRLAKGAIAFSKRNLEWRRSAVMLANFYTSLTRS